MIELNDLNRNPDEREAFRQEIFASLHCALPGIVESFDPEWQTVTVRPALKRMGRGEVVEAPFIRDVPVFFPGTRTQGITWMVEPGDECLLIFADSAIDGWFESGEAAEPESGRMHDWSDAFVFVGFRSKPNALQAFPEEPSLFGSEAGDGTGGDGE